VQFVLLSKAPIRRLSQFRPRTFAEKAGSLAVTLWNIVPELPEVENRERGLQPTVEGRKFTYVENPGAAICASPFPRTLKIA